MVNVGNDTEISDMFQVGKRCFCEIFGHNPSFSLKSPSHYRMSRRFPERLFASYHTVIRSCGFTNVVAIIKIINPTP